MLTIRSFFASIPEPLRGLLIDDAMVWEGLRGLKPFLADWSFSPLPPGIGNGVPLPATVALHQGRLYTDDLDITFGDATKGGLVVVSRGQHLEGAAVLMAGAVLVGDRIQIGRGCLVESGALVREPVIIGDQTEIRQGAYVRGYCVTGARCVIGHTTEIKHSIFLDDAKAGHFAYIGDSILGNRVNLGAGTKLANLRFLKGNVVVKTPEGTTDTGLRKLGAILGDDVQTGCNSVTSPGTLLQPRCMLFPNVTAPSGLHSRSSALR